jgi:putative hydrolase of the HAD superfamily
MDENQGAPREEGRRAAVEVVYFDAGGTLLHVRPSVGHVYAEAVARLGHHVDPDCLNAAFREAWGRSLERRRAALYVSNDDFLREEWRRIVGESFEGRVPKEAVDETFPALYDHFSGPKPWAVAEGAVETLSALREEGIRVGVLSNWDSRLPRTLAELGLRPHLDFLVVSYAVGVEKPHPGIFHEAARRAGARPESLLMVGDSWDQDVKPALALGWRAIWLSPGHPERTAAGEEADQGPAETARTFSEVLERVRSLGGSS